MTGLYPTAMNTAAAQPVLGLFTAIQIDLPASVSLPATTLCMLDGSGVMAWGGNTFVGSDGDYGVWCGVGEPIEDGIVTTSPKFKTTFKTLSQTANQQLCQPESQLAPVLIYYGYYNLATGLPVSDPIVWFSGYLDNGNLTTDDSSADVDLNIVAGTELMFLPNDGARLNGAYHQIFFSGENGFAFVDGVSHQIPWGVGGPRPDQVTDVSNFDNSPGPKSTRLRF